MIDINAAKSVRFRILFSIRTFPTPKYHYKWDRWPVGLGKVRNNISIGGGRGGRGSLTHSDAWDPPQAPQKSEPNSDFIPSRQLVGHSSNTHVRVLYSFILRLISKTWFMTLFFKLWMSKCTNVSTNLRNHLTFQLIPSKLVLY